MAQVGVARLGWVGLGQMGQAHVSNLLKHGFRVSVWNRDATKAKALAAQGAEVLTSPQQVVEQSDATFIMLSSPGVARQVYGQDGGVLSGVTAAKGVVECASLDADTMRELRALVEQQGGRFLAAPVAGHSAAARDATCQFLCAGDEALYGEVGSALDAMSKNRVFLGPQDAGAASNLKLVINGLLANITASVSEALAVCEGADVDTAVLHNVVSQHAMGSPLVQLCMGKMRNEEHSPPLFQLKHMAKDTRLAAALAQALGQASPITDATRDLYAAAEDAVGDLNWTAVHDTVRKQ